jgi:hypothetical protein
MAFKMNIPMLGGIEHADGYVRVTDVRICKKDDTSDWFMMVDVAAYKDADARTAQQRLSTPHVDKFKFAYSVDDAATPAAAYAKLKTHDTFKDKTTDV